MKSTLRLLCRWLYLPLAVLCGFYLSLARVQHSNWYKERLYHQLLCGNEHERLKAASALASVGGQEQLLTALKAETPEVRELARRALEYIWFTGAGHHAHQVIEEAFDAAEKEDFQTALTLLDRLVREHPAFAEGWNRRASVYWKMGQFDKSIADCQKALALNPNHYGAWQGIGVCRVELGDIAEACRCLRAALKITPYDEPTRRCLQKCEELLRNLPNRVKSSGKSDFI